jgi:vitamin B12 transporter
MKKTLLAASITAALSQQIALAENSMLITATRTPSNIDTLGSTVSLITAKDIDRKQYVSLDEVLMSVPGLNVVQSGGKGAQTSVFLRGTNSEHVLVLIDGVEMNDPSTPSGAFDFSNFLVEGIESIEVVRGSQSVLYGSDAIGGVIQIRTKKGQGDLNFRVKAGVGTQSTHRESAVLSGEKNNFNYSVAIGRLDTDGESIAAKKKLAPGSITEDDNYENIVFSTRLGWKIFDSLEADFTARYIETEADIDGGFDFSGNTAEDADATNDSEQLYLGLELKGLYADGVWQPILTASRSDIERQSKDERQSPFGTLVDTNFDGQKTKFALQNNLFLFENQIITIGFEHESEEMNSKGFSDFGGFIINQLTNADRDTKSTYIQDQIEVNDQLFITVGARYDDTDDIGSELTYRTTASYNATENTRLHAAYGTGFKAPSLFQLFGFTPNNFGSAYSGNPNLDAETSDSWEIGIDQLFFASDIKTSITYFETKVEDLITTQYIGFNSTSVNRDNADMSGVESAIHFKALSNLNIDINHTYTRTKDEDNKELLRRPKHKANIEFNYEPAEHININTNVLYTGQRVDVDGFGQRVDVGGYSVVNVAAAYKLSNNVKLFARLDNLTDKYYEPAYGFQALGRAGFIGVELIN